MLLAEAAKFTRTALAVVATLTDVDVIVTDAEAPEGVVAALRAGGVDVRRA